MTARFRDCEWCGFAFPIKNSRARFCSDAHRAAAARARATEAALLAEQGQMPEPAPAPAPLSALLDEATLQTLVQAVAAQLSPLAAPAAAAPDDAEPTESPREPTYGPQETAVRAQLAAAGRMTTPMGQAAVALAFRIDNSQGETLSALAAGTKALQERLTAALIGTALGSPGAPPAPSGEDEDGDESESSAGERVSQMEDGRRRRESRRFGA